MQANTETANKRVAIFGLGPTGTAMAQVLSAAGYAVDGFSRSRCLGQGIRLDLSDGDTVRELSKHLGHATLAVVTVPPQDLATEFWNVLEPVPQRILLGTTGIYRRQGNQPVTEATALVADHDRLVVEEQFLAAGGLLVRLAGLYGVGRNPADWVRRGRVGYEPRQVNLVHHLDVARAILELARDWPGGGQVFNLADGQRHTWRQVIEALVESGTLDHPREPTAASRADAVVDPSRFLQRYPEFSFRDFWTELGNLNQEDRHGT